MIMNPSCLSFYVFTYGNKFLMTHKTCAVSSSLPVPCIYSHLCIESSWLWNLISQISQILWNFSKTWDLSGSLLVFVMLIRYWYIEGNQWAFFFYMGDSQCDCRATTQPLLFTTHLCVNTLSFNTGHQVNFLLTSFGVWPFVEKTRLQTHDCIS